MRRAARAVANHYDDVLAPSGLKGTQFTLLNAIVLADSPTITELAQLLLLDRTTLSRNLKPLQQQGLVRLTTGKDARARALALSAQGNQALQKALPLWDKAQASVEQLLGKARLRNLQSDLRTLEKLASGQ